MKTGYYYNFNLDRFIVLYPNNNLEIAYLIPDEVFTDKGIEYGRIPAYYNWLVMPDNVCIEETIIDSEYIGKL